MSLSALARSVQTVAVAVALLLFGVAVAHAANDDRSPARAIAASTSGGALRAPATRTVRTSAGHLHPGSVFVVGDSLTVGTEPWLSADVSHREWRLAGVDARIGRPVAEGLQVLRDRGSSLPGTVVIALGTNDLSADQATVAGWLASARAILGHRRIIWVNLCLAANVDPWLGAYRTINAALERAAPRYGVHVADWCAYAHAHGLRPGADGIHYSSADYRQRASFYAAVIAGA